ncbi:MAG: DeoR/GlpR family DNA-binding transcription regulator [Eubacteriales bacterium]
MAGELKIDVRRKKILELLRRDGQVRVTQLSEQLGATVVTIRSDLDALEQDGYLERTQGGAIQTTKNFYNMEFQRRKQERNEIKRAIAAYVADMIPDGGTLFMNSGITTYFTAMELKKRRNINVVTNSLSVAVELGDVPTFRVILLGGDINAQYSYTHGEDAKVQLSRYKAEYTILSLDGISAEHGLSTLHAEESVINRMMMERSQKTMIVADSSKLGHESFAKFAEISDITYWITDKSTESAMTEKIALKGVEIRFI